MNPTQLARKCAILYFCMMCLIPTNVFMDLFYIKSAQKVWNILKTMYFLGYLEIMCIVLYTIAKLLLSALQCYVFAEEM